MSKRIFIIGVTGYVGGSVFTTLKAAHPTYTYIALVRNPAHISTVTAAGASPILGSSTDRETIADQAFQADVVIDCLGYDENLHNAVLEGIKKRKESGRGLGIYILTTGTSIFGDWGKDGKWVEGTKVWSDGSVEDMKAIIKEKVHTVDASLIRASERGDVLGYVVSPPAVYGVGTGPVSRVSTHLKIVCGIYVEKGKAFFVGEGTNKTGYVHISDLAALYLLILDHALTLQPQALTPDSAYERYIIAVDSTRDNPWPKAAALFGAALHKFGKIPSAEVGTLTYEEAGLSGLPGALFAANFPIKAERAKSLGWVPNGPLLEDTVLEAVELYTQTK